MYRWCVAAFSSDLWNIPTPVDQVLDRCTSAARTASREDIRAHVSPVVSPMIIENRQLAAGLRLCVHLARLPLELRHRQQGYFGCRERVIWRVEWHSVAFTDENRFCLYASNGHSRVRSRPGERHLLECIHLRHTGSTSGFKMWGPSVQRAVTFGDSAGLSKQ